jgi:hypothetical protein
MKSHAQWLKDAEAKKSNQSKNTNTSTSAIYAFN